MSNPNKNKGKNWERDVAKYLTSLFGVNFMRIQNSGAFIGNSNLYRAGNMTHEQIVSVEGDINCPKILENIRIECKFYQKIAWKCLFNSDGESNLNKWIEQSKIGTKPLWLICFKINNSGSFVLFDKTLMSNMNLGCNYLVYRDNYIVCELNKFFELNKEKLIEIGGKHE
jgi:hypothetical protein